MKEFAGDPDFPIWLVGDSPPEAWVDALDMPLDPRHPARHSIWTPVADAMQERLYREGGRRRLDTSRLYIRNAAGKPFRQPLTEDQIHSPAKALRELLDKYRPSMILTFGVSAFMVALYASGETPDRIFRTTKLLGEQFRKRVANFRDNKVNVIPLLHASISRGKFLESHRDFVDGHGSEPPNYFEYVGKELANLLLVSLSKRSIWVE